MSAASGHLFYGALDSALPGTAAITVAKKVAIDQLFWNPCFGGQFCLLFFSPLVHNNGLYLNPAYSHVLLVPGNHGGQVPFPNLRQAESVSNLNLFL
jgi:hypothetical protein